MPREKIKFALRIRPETQQLVKDIFPLDGCENQSEFIEKAIRFYAGYVTSKNGTEFLAPILVSALQGTVENAENHIARLLFKLAVEIGINSNITAAVNDISDESLDTVRLNVAQEVARTNGILTFEDADEWQNGGD